MQKFDIYWANFALEEDHAKIKRRPVLLLDADIIVPIAKITSVIDKYNGPNDFYIEDWKDIGLDKASVIRFDKIQLIKANDLLEEDRIGQLSIDDINKLKERHLI